MTQGKRRQNFSLRKPFLFILVFRFGDPRAAPSVIVSEHSGRVFDDNSGQNKGSPAGARASTAAERTVADPQHTMTVKTDHLPGSTREPSAWAGRQDCPSGHAVFKA